MFTLLLCALHTPSNVLLVSPMIGDGRGSKGDNCRNKWVMILEVFYHQQSAHILSWGCLGE